MDEEDFQGSPDFIPDESGYDEDAQVAAADEAASLRDYGDPYANEDDALPENAMLTQGGGSPDFIPDSPGGSPDFIPDVDTSRMGVFTRAAVQSAPSAIGSIPAMAAGALLGAEWGAKGLGALGALAGPEGIPIGAAVGGFAGGVAGAVAGGMGAGTLINKGVDIIKDKFMSPEAREAERQQNAADEAAHPVMRELGSLAPSVVGFGARLPVELAGKSLGERLAFRSLMGGTQGGIAAGQEYMETGEVTPWKAGLAGAFGGTFATPRGPGKMLWQAGEGAVPGRWRPAKPDQASQEDLNSVRGAEPANLNAGISAENAAPAERGEVGNPRAPGGTTASDAGSTYDKTREQRGAETPGVEVLEPGAVPADKAQAMAEALGHSEKPPEAQPTMPPGWQRMPDGSWQKTPVQEQTPPPAPQAPLLPPDPQIAQVRDQAMEYSRGMDPRDRQAVNAAAPDQVMQRAAKPGPAWEQEFNQKHGSAEEDYARHRLSGIDDPESPHYEPMVDEQGLRGIPDLEARDNELKAGLAEFWTAPNTKGPASNWPRRVHEELTPVTEGEQYDVTTGRRILPDEQQTRAEPQPQQQQQQQQQQTLAETNQPAPEARESSLERAIALAKANNFAQAVVRLEQVRRLASEGKVAPAVAEKAGEAYLKQAGENARSERIQQGLRPEVRPTSKEEAPSVGPGTVTSGRAARTPTPEGVLTFAERQPTIPRGSYPVHDAEGNVVASARSKKLAGERATSLRTAAEARERFPMPEVDPTTPTGIKAIMEQAKAALTWARENGWKHQIRGAKDGEGVPRDAMWMSATKAVAEGRKPVAEYFTDDKLLRGSKEDINLVRASRKEQGDLARKQGLTPEDAEAQKARGGRKQATPAADARLGEPERTFGKRTEAPSTALYTGREGPTRVEVQKTVKLKDLLARADISQIGGKFSEGYAHLAREIAAQDPNALFHITSHEAMDLMGHDVFGTPDILGMYDRKQHAGFLRPDLPPEITLHEAVHAITARRIESNPKLKQYIRDFMDALRDNPAFKGAEAEYAFRNEHEFLTMGNTNPKFQEQLAQVKMSPENARMLALGEQANFAGKITNGFKAFVEVVRKVLGLDPTHFTALEGVIKLTDIARNHPDRYGLQSEFGGHDAAMAARLPPETQRDMDGIIKKVRRALSLPLWNTSRIAQHADTLGKAFGKAVRGVSDGVAKAAQRVETHQKLDNHMMDRLNKLQEQFKGPVINEFVQRVLRQSETRTWANEANFRDAFKGMSDTRAWAQPKHADQVAWWNGLPPELKTWANDYANVTKHRQEQLAGTAAANILEKFKGLVDEPLLNRIRNDTMTPADEAAVGPDVTRIIKHAYDIADSNAPYVRQAREGGHVVLGKYKVDAPPDALRELPGRSRPTYEFDSKAKADSFAGAQEGQTSVNGYWVYDGAAKYTDPQGNIHTPGERYYQDAKGKDHAYDKADPDVARRYSATVQDQHLEFLDTQYEATARERELHQSGQMVPNSTDAQLKRYVPSRDAHEMASQLGLDLEKQLKNNQAYQSSTPAMQAEIRQMLAEQHVQMIAGTRTHNSRLRRENVRGYDQDLMRSILGHSQQTSHQLARAELDPEIMKAHAEAKAEIGKDKSLSTAQLALHNELTKRLEGWQGDKYNLNSVWYGPAMHRLMTVSAAARLFTPRFWIQNGTQLGTHTGPVLKAEYGGQGHVLREMYQVAKDIGYGKVIAAGARAMGKAIKGNYENPTYIGDLKSRLKDPLDREALDYLVEHGAIDGDAGFQMEKMQRSREGVKLDIGRRESKVRDVAEAALTRADRGIEWLGEVSRSMSNAVEVNNRAVTGLTAFRLEMARNGGDKQAAFAKAKDIVDNTQVRYRKEDRPLWEQHPLAQPAMQFKQFGKAQYAIYGRAIGQVIKNAEPGDRATGLLTLAGITATHMAVAGLLGLPTEPARMLMVAARAFGITDKEWDDLEHLVRNLSAQALGPKGGEALTKGLPRLLGLDLSANLGINNPLFFSAPRSGTDRDYDNNLQSWLFQMIGGAPASLAIQGVHGFRDLMNGDITKAAEKLSPMKVGSDVLRAYNQFEEGKKTDRGRQTSAPYNAYEAGLRATGFTPSREANEQEASRYFNVAKGRDIGDHAKLTAAYVKAVTEGRGDDRAKTINKALQGGLTMQELNRAVVTARTASNRSINNQAVTKRTAPLARSLTDTYNLGQ